MTLRVFHPPGAWAPGLQIRLEPEESHYLLRVRRARPGRAVELLDGEAASWEARLASTEGATAVLELLHARPALPSMPLELLLVVPEPRATLESLTVASELGATGVWLSPGEHSPGGVPSAERIARTLRAAQRQCGRRSPPVVHGPTPLAAALAQTMDRPGYVASPVEYGRASSVEVSPARGARVLVGPEGGLSPTERAAAAEAGLRPLSLGPWILRTPTAVAAGLARLSGAAAPDPAADPVGEAGP